MSIRELVLMVGANGRLALVAWVQECCPSPSPEGESWERPGLASQLPPGPTSRVLSWPTPTYASFRSCWMHEGQFCKAMVTGSLWLGQQQDSERSFGEGPILRV